MKDASLGSIDTNSKRSRVEPVLGWLRESSGLGWPARLLELSDGLDVSIEPGALVGLHFEEEVQVPASAARIAWMIRNAERLAPVDGRRWQEYRRRIIENPQRDEALAKLDRDDRGGVDKRLILEGPSHVDCLIECEHAFIWLEGKRNDWLSPSIAWDVTRDQLARNLEAAWLLARPKQKDYCIVVCHQHPLKHHEQLLVDGYRRGTWTGGWPHIDGGVRRDFGARIATVTWREIANEWPEMGDLGLLRDLPLV